MSYTCGPNGWHDAVHFNRGRNGHTWICISCGKSGGGKALGKDEKEALIEFAKHFRKMVSEKQNARKGSTARTSTKTEDNMKLELAILAGAESKQFLVDFTKQIDRLEKLAGKTTAPTKAAAAAIEDDDDMDDVNDETADAAADEDDDFAPKKKSAKQKAAAAFEDDEDEPAAEAASDEDDDEDFTAPPAKKAPAKAKAKKVTLDDVNDACKARAKVKGGKEGRAEVLTILKKKFKTDSVSSLKPEQYQAVIDAMEA